MAAYEAQKFEWYRNGVWYDITGWVDGRMESQAGRPSGFDSPQNGVGTLTLNNADHRWTPGNSSSPEYPYWRQDQRIRCRETIGYRSFDTWTMYVVPPEVSEWVESGDQTITVPLIDRLGWLDTSRTFISTLTEHIRYTGGSALRAYYPMLETAGSTVSSFAAIAQPSLRIEPVPAFGRAATADLVELGTFGTPLPGDDRTSATWTTHLDGSSSTDGALGVNPRLQTDLATFVTLTGSLVVTFVIWVYISSAVGSEDQVVWFAENHAAGGGSALLKRYTATGVWRLQLTFNDVDILNLDSAGPVAYNRWTHIAVRIRLSPNVQEMWVDNAPVVTGAVPGVIPGSVQYQVVSLGGPFAGSLAHFQLYLSNAAVDYSSAIHQDQKVHAYNGLDRQRTDERIRTLAHYAGVTDADLQLDTGVALMQQASLAGVRAAGLMRAAVDTERGRLFVNGANQITFHNRTRTYNV